MESLKIYLFGKFDVYYGNQALAALDACKAQELFCYLLLNRTRPHAREVLADRLWSDCTATQSKGYLRKALWQLQTALEAQVEGLGNRVILLEPGWVQINPQAELCFDVAAFEQAFVQVRGIHGKQLDTQQVHVLQAAADLYRADLLEGWYQDWCIHERERLRHLYLAVLDKLMSYCEVHCNFETGLTYGSRSLHYDRARERTHRRMMRLHCLAGDRTSALRQFELCETALKDELGVRPSKRTIDLYRRIKADQLSIRAPDLVVLRPVPEDETPSLPEILNRLKHIQVVLADTQHQIRQDIRAVERALQAGQSHIP